MQLLSQCKFSVSLRDNPLSGASLSKASCMHAIAKEINKTFSSGKPIAAQTYHASESTYLVRRVWPVKTF